MLADNALLLCAKATSYASNLDNNIRSTLSAGTYSTDDFNVKIKEALLRQREDCKAPQIKVTHLKLQILITHYHLP